MGAATGALARVIVLARHRRYQAMETRLAGKLRMEGRGEHVSLSDGNDPAVIETSEDIDVGTDRFDDRRPDEDGVDRAVAEHRDAEVGLERVELSAEGVPLDADIEERQDGRLATDDLTRQDDHPGACPEEWGAGRGQAANRVGEVPALDELAHRRALATGQDQPRHPV